MYSVLLIMQYVLNVRHGALCVMHVVVDLTYYVVCAMCSVLCNMLNVFCIMYLNNKCVLILVHDVLYMMYSVAWKWCNVLVIFVLWIMYCVLCSMYYI